MEMAAVAAALLWSFKAGAPADAPPVVNEGRVFYAAADKKLYALNAEDGRCLWSRRFKAPLATPPVVTGDVVIQFVPFPEDRIYALAVEDGKKLWTAKAGPGIISVASADGIIAAGYRHSLTFYDEKTGLTVGGVNLGGRVEGIVYAGKGAFVGATAAGVLSLARVGSPRALWVKDLGAGVSALAAGGDKVYAVLSPGVLDAWSLGDGREIWRRPLEGPGWVGLSLNERGLVVTGTRRVLLCDAETGEVLWTFGAGRNVVGCANYGEGYIVAFEDGEVAFTKGGNVSRVCVVNKRVVTRPVVAGDLLFLADGEGRLACYRLNCRSIKNT